MGCSSIAAVLLIAVTSSANADCKTPDLGDHPGVRPDAFGLNSMLWSDFEAIRLLAGVPEEEIRNGIGNLNSGDPFKDEEAKDDQIKAIKASLDALIKMYGSAECLRKLPFQGMQSFMKFDGFDMSSHEFTFCVPTVVGIDDGYPFPITFDNHSASSLSFAYGSLGVGGACTDQNPSSNFNSFFSGEFFRLRIDDMAVAKSIFDAFNNSEISATVTCSDFSPNYAGGSCNVNSLVIAGQRNDLAALTLTRSGDAWSWSWPGN